MIYKKYQKIYIALIYSFGSTAIIYALYNLEKGLFSWQSSLFLLIGLLITSRLTLSLPTSNSYVNFSDMMIFFAFLYYGGETAVLLAVTEAAFSCYYLKYTGVSFTKTTIFFNIASVSLVTSITFLVWTYLPSFGIPHDYGRTDYLISTLAILAITQFLGLSSLMTIFFSLKNNQNVFKVWKNVCFTSSMTHIAGAASAGVFYKLFSLGSIFTIAVSFIVFGIVYLNYRQMISNIKKSIKQAEEAVREKTEANKRITSETQAHADQLKILLEQEEKISTDLRQSKKDLEYAAFHDKLTDLPNRNYLVERLNLLLELGIGVSQTYYVLFLDLSRFKNINDSLGHTIGDEVLKVVALRLRRVLRDEDTIARLGGDEFAIILNDLPSIETAQDFARRIYEKLTKPYVIQGNKIFSDLNIGIAPFDSEQLKPEDVLRDADIAMHNAKEKKINIAVFDKDIRLEYLEHLKLEDDLRYATEKNELSMHYQPLINLKDGSLLGFEALLRWHHSELGFISPAKFIPISEDSGLIIPITKWILQETCVQLVSWKKISDDYKDLLVSVNISGRHLAVDNLFEDVQNALEVSGLPARSLKLEITESTAMDNASRTIKILNELKKIGVQISIDDFGTGYSSLSYLHKLPFDTLKIDRSFVINATEGDEDSEILQTIVSLTKNLKKEVIAEGIETEEQLKLLTDMGCHYGQGYLFSRPLPKCDMETMLYKKTSWMPHFVEETKIEANTSNNSTQDNLSVF